MADEQIPDYVSPPLLEFTDVAIEIPPEARRRAQHLPENCPESPWKGWLVTGGVAVVAFLAGWLLGRA